MKVHEFDCICFECVDEKKFHRQLTTREVTEMMEKEMAKVKKHDPGENWTKERKEKENKERHLNHPFYKRVDNMVEEVAREQVLKGADKYPEPFNPASWTGPQLVRHGLQEARDLQVYLVGALDHMERQEEMNKVNHQVHNEMVEELEKYKNRCKDYERKINELTDEHIKLKEEKHELRQEVLQVEKVYEETLEDLNKHKNALVEISVAFSKELTKTTNENAALKNQMAKLSKQNNENISIIFNAGIEPTGLAEEVKAMLDKGLKDANNNI